MMTELVTIVSMIMDNEVDTILTKILICDIIT